MIPSILVWWQRSGLFLGKGTLAGVMGRGPEFQLYGFEVSVRSQWDWQIRSVALSRCPSWT